MKTATAPHRFPAGTGWAIGLAAGLLLGLVGWRATGQAAMLAVLTAAVGTALGAALENALDTESFTSRQRRLLLALVGLGLLAASAVLLLAVILG